MPRRSFKDIYSEAQAKPSISSGKRTKIWETDNQDNCIEWQKKNVDIPKYCRSPPQLPSHFFVFEEAAEEDLRGYNVGAHTNRSLEKAYSAGTACFMIVNPPDEAAETICCSMDLFIFAESS